MQIEARDELGTRSPTARSRWSSPAGFPAPTPRRRRSTKATGRVADGSWSDSTGVPPHRPFARHHRSDEGAGDDGTAFWTMPIGPTSRNGFGGLHGGVAFDLVTEAAIGGSTELLGPVDAHGALLRYLAPTTVGPFRAVPIVMPQDDGSVFSASRSTTTATMRSCAFSARSTRRSSSSASRTVPNRLPDVADRATLASNFGRLRWRRGCGWRR